MKCINNELIQTYIDKEASANEIFLIENHIEECPECALNIIHRRNLSRNIVSSINKLNSEFQPVPDFIHPDIPPERKLLNGKRILYSVSVACLLLFVMILIRNNHPEDESLLRAGARLEVEVDANRPVTEQPVLIQVTDPDGNVTEYNLN